MKKLCFILIMVGILKVGYAQQGFPKYYRLKAMLEKADSL